jgi:hypothetical protein
MWHKERFQKSMVTIFSKELIKEAESDSTYFLLVQGKEVIKRRWGVGRSVGDVGHGFLGEARVPCSAHTVTMSCPPPPPTSEHSRVTNALFLGRLFGTSLSIYCLRTTIPVQCTVTTSFAHWVQSRGSGCRTHSMQSDFLAHTPSGD